MSVESLLPSDPSLAAPLPASPPSTRPRPATRWVVERILKCRSINPLNYQISLRAAAGHLECLEFLVDWAGYSESSRSWITVDNFGGGAKSEMLVDFMKTKAISHFENPNERVPLAAVGLAQQFSEDNLAAVREMEIMAAMEVLAKHNALDKKAWQRYADNVSLATLESITRLQNQRAAH